MLDLPVEDLGERDYASAYQRQGDVHAQVLAARQSFEAMPDSGQWPHLPGRLLLVEHVPPVITVSNRPNAAAHLLASSQQLERLGVTVAQTDRGGDITYHGPGQLVAYPILDLNVLRLRLHDYLRLLEAVVIDLLATLEVPSQRDPSATGVWVPMHHARAAHDVHAPPAETAKVCAMGVRVRQWVTLHGLALNVTTNLSHFDLIVPCGLAGRAVTSIEREYAARFPAGAPGSFKAMPSLSGIKSLLAETLARHLNAHLDARSLDPRSISPTP